MASSFVLTKKIPAKAKDIYEAWLDGEKHSQMTGGQADCQPIVGYSFTAWDGYILGSNKVLEKNKRIVQFWRTTEFAETDADSEIEITLKEDKNECILTLTHSNIPDGQSNYEAGWEEHYFEPMLTYFSSKK